MLLPSRKRAKMYKVSETARKFKIDSRPVIRQPEDTVPHFLPNVPEGREAFQVAFLDTRHRLIVAPWIVSIGTLNASLVHPREVFREAIKHGAAAIIVSHNHPSGCPRPSADDIALTERLDKCGELLGISLLDHIITGEDSHLSLREEGTGF